MAARFRPSRPLLLVGSLFLCAGVAFAGIAHRDVVSKVAPSYPELARRMHVGGTVVLLVTVQPDGVVSKTKVESGHPLLTAAAEDAVKRWHFAPGPDTSESEITVNFRNDGQ
ncbi:MAG: energy transducer TonB [Acidobacteriales bacterium]|nr:energy transducer TonB [Terriglobales bacterium]